MQRQIIRASLLVTLLSSTACTQPPAMVELKGQNTYGRDGVISNYAANAPAVQAAPVAPVSQTTSQVASNSSIGVSELSAPAKSEAKAEPAKPAAPVKIASSDSSQKINPWTGKPHFSDAQPPQDQALNIQPQGKQSGKPQMVADVSKPAVKPQPKAVAQLDTSKAVKTAKANSFMWPVASHKVLSGFGPKGGGKVNDGINIASADGEPIWAAADGEVVYAGNGLQGYGNMVLIKHPDGKTSAYAHMSRYTVDKYERVKQGDIIGYVGTTGNVKEPQLHFAIRDGKDPVDPRKYLSSNVASN